MFSTICKNLLLSGVVSLIFMLIMLTFTSLETYPPSASQL